MKSFMSCLVVESQYKIIRIGTERMFGTLIIFFNKLLLKNILLVKLLFMKVLN